MKLRRMLVIGALLAAPLVALSAPTTAGAVTPGEVLFQSAGASLKADGHTWLVSVQYTDAGTPTGLGSGIAVNVQRLVTGVTSFEGHSWSADAKGAKFTANSVSGKATLSSGTSLSPVATVNVSFVPKKKKVSACPVFGKETVFTGTVKGSVHIVTGTRPVSITLSSKAASFTSEGTSTLTVSPCLFNIPCFGDGWSAPESSTGIPFGEVGAAGTAIYEGKSLVHFVTVIRQTELKKATAFIREDEATQDVSAPKWNSKSKTLTVGASGIVTGSGVLTGGKGSTHASPEGCYIEGKKHNETYSIYLGAKLSKWKAFVGHTVLSGNLTASSKGVGGITIYTVS